MPLDYLSFISTLKPPTYGYIPKGACVKANKIADKPILLFDRFIWWAPGTTSLEHTPWSATVGEIVVNGAAVIGSGTSSVTVIVEAAPGAMVA